MLTEIPVVFCLHHDFILLDCVGRHIFTFFPYSSKQLNTQGSAVSYFVKDSGRLKLRNYKVFEDF